MKAGEIFLEILKIGLPAALVLIGMLMVFNRASERKDAQERFLMRMEAFQKYLPLRLQAYERGILFLERISPENLIIRCEAAGKNMRQFQAQLTAEIRAEYEHNMAQQLYISAETWFEVVKAKEQIIGLVNACAIQLPPGSSAADLGKRIIETMMRSDHAPTHVAILVLKAEVQKMFKV